MEVGLAYSPSHRSVLAAAGGVSTPGVMEGVTEMNEQDMVPTQEDQSWWGHRELARWLHHGVSVMEEGSLMNPLRPLDVLAQVWQHLSFLFPAPSPIPCQELLRHPGPGGTRS